jgi:hypothetical protein
MTQDEVFAVLDQVMAMTDQMRLLARQENWVEVARTEGDRQKLLMECLENIEIRQSTEIANRIQQILEVDREMQGLVIEARNAIRDELIQLNKEKDAARAYGAK